MKEVKELYDSAVKLLEDCNRNHKKLPFSELETLNILLTSVVSNLNGILVETVKKDKYAENTADAAQKTGSGD